MQIAKYKSGLHGVECPPMKASRIVTSTLKIVVTVLLLFLIFRSVDVYEIRQDLKALDTTLLIFLMAASWIGQLLCSQRWRLLAGSLGLRGNFRSFVQMYFVGMFFNVGLPSLVGGDVIKAFVLSRKTGTPIQAGFASVLQDRVAGLISMLLYGTVAIAIYPITWRGIPLAIPYLLIWLVVISSLLLVWIGDKLFKGVLVPGHTSLRQKFFKFVADFHRELSTMRIGAGAAAQVIIFSMLNSALVLWVYQMITVAAGYKVGLVPFSALFPMIVFVTMLPISIGGLGVREWAYVEALALVGVPGNSALLIALTTSAFMIALNIVGALFLPAMPSELRSARSFEVESELEAEGDNDTPSPSSGKSCAWSLPAELRAQEMEGGNARR
jgi:glycosyltransferase 2 family protein